MMDPTQTPPDLAAPSQTEQSLRAYLQLMRFPALFTALADILLGFALTHGSLGDDLTVLFLLAVTSSCLYLSGMVLNDYFDRHRDALERPERPIPSGRVSPRSALILATLLILTGFAAAGTIVALRPELWRWNPLLLATLITLALLLYDGLLKQTPAGPLIMGLCRFLNVSLGASAFGLPRISPFWRPQLWVAVGLGIYIVGVTWFARTEAVTSRRLSLWGAFVTVNLGLATLLGWIVNWPIAADWKIAALLLAVTALTVNKRMLAAIFSPGPRAVQASVATLLSSIIVIDATLIYAKTAQAQLAFAMSVALLIPTFVMKRVIRIT